MLQRSVKGRPRPQPSPRIEGTPEYNERLVDGDPSVTPLPVPPRPIPRSKPEPPPRQIQTRRPEPPPRPDMPPSVPSRNENKVRLCFMICDIPYFSNTRPALIPNPALVFSDPPRTNSKIKSKNCGPKRERFRCLRCNIYSCIDT